MTPLEKEADSLGRQLRYMNKDRNRLYDKMKKMVIQLRCEDKRKWTQSKIAEIFDVNQSTISEWCSKSMEGDISDRATYSDELKQQVVQRYKEGVKQTDIAVDFNVSQKTISNILNK